jgi:serine/threonine protein kinase
MESSDDIFLKARELSDATERAAYLKQACGGDPALMGKVEAMLRDSEGAEEFFGKGGTAMVAPPGALEQAGTLIGRYKLLQKIGEGGMGVVYMAEQREPVVRKVALKIIKLGMDTRQVVARFEAERQALALMEHPNIATVLDGGTTESGRPYFVMELVQGLPITQFCDDAKFPPSQRIKLFLDVCSAVQHAHQKGVIHRDLKPSNILVTLHGEQPVPKVIDFGVAKATHGRLTDKTVFTQFQQFIGTPAYMSPEQTSLSGLDVDTRSDIYALGVLLYELLTGKTPFDPNELLKAGLEHMRQVIREQEPPKPSTRLSTMQGEDLTTTARQRHTEPPKLIHLLRGDLDWIVMKCLEKDRGRRYESASAVATDLQRHLANEPVVARPPTLTYRLQKAIRRNRVAFAAATAVTAALVAGLAVSLFLLVRERAARERAVAAEREQSRLRAVAETNRLQAEANSFMDRGLLRLRDGELAGAEESYRRALSDSQRGWPETPGQWERSLGGLVEVLMRRTNFQAADEVLRQTLTPPVASATSSLPLRQIRAEFFARRGQWKEAIDDANRLVAVQPTNYAHYHRLIPLLVVIGDVERYRSVCQQMLSRFADTETPLTAEITAKNCLILPGSGADLQLVSKLARLAVSSRIKNPASMAIFSFTQGLAEYRQGRFASAADYLARSLTTTSNVYAHIEAYAVLAMAQHQSNDAAAARATLTRGIGLQETEGPRLADGDLTSDWRAWIRGQALMQEAKALITGD